MPIFSSIGGFFGGPVGGLIGGAADFLLNRHSGERRRDQAVTDMERNMAFQREMAQMGIQWRVADAKKAGVHPLYALGAALPSGSPITVGGDFAGDTGQDLSRVVGAADPMSRRKAELELRLLESQIGENDARAELARSEAARRSQPGQAAPQPMWIPEGSAPYRPVGEPQAYQLEPGATAELPGAFDVVKPKASEQVAALSTAPWMEPSLSGGSKEYRLTRNMKVLLPAANDLGEALEPLSESLALMWMWYRINVDHYGPHFTDLAFQELGFPNWMLRVVKGAGGWYDWANMRPGVRYTGPGSFDIRRPSSREYFPERR